MEILKLNCASCGSPIQIHNDTEFVTCPSCSTQMVVDRGEDFLSLKIAEQVSQAINQSGTGTQSAIRDGTQTTQSEIKRLQITQDLSMLNLQLSSIQSEIRALQREKQSKTQRLQLNELLNQEGNLKQRIAFLQNALVPPQPMPSEAERQMQARILREQQERREKQAQAEKLKSLIESEKKRQFQAEKEQQLKLEQEKLLAIRNQERYQSQVEAQRIQLQKEEIRRAKNLNRKPVSGWLFVGLGVPILIVGSALFFLFSLAQITGGSELKENLTGFIGAQVLCPLPLLLIGLILTMIGIVRLVRRKKLKA